jgi:predicted nucleic acid-binding protein
VTTYFDTSALLKLLVEEEGSDVAALSWDGADVILTSRLAYPEARAALASAGRGGRLSRDAGAIAKRSLEGLWRQLRVVEVSPEVAADAGELAESHALRGYDAVHLASALAVLDDELLMVTWDDDLATAARREGLTVAPALS